MRYLPLSLVPLVLASAVLQTAQAAQQSEAEGLPENGSLTLTNRNYYFNYDYKDGEADARDWAQALLADFQSGFTRGTLGFGIDAFAYGVLKLDAQGGGTGNVALRDDGDTDSFAHVGAALKLRISSTVLKYGVMQPVAPVFAAGGTQILPQTARGLHLFSEEIDNLDLEAGHFTAATGWSGSSNHEPILANYAAVETASADYLGGRYTFGDDLSLSLYAARFEDLWHQYYGNLTYTLPLGDEQALTFDLSLYRTRDEGQSRAGDIDNTAWSLAAGYSLGGHTFTLAYQQVHGDEPFDFAGFGEENSSGDSIYLANSVQYSDFNGPGEKSVQARYDLDMAAYGVPGLSFMVRYIHGRDVDGSQLDADSPYRELGYGDDDSERETNIEAWYVVQEGPAKDLTFAILQAWHRGDASLGGDANEFRLMIEYPLEIL